MYYMEWKSSIPTISKSPPMTKSNSHAQVPHLWAHRLLFSFLSLWSAEIIENKGFRWVWEREKNQLGTLLLLKYWLSCTAPRMRMLLINSFTLFNDNILTLWARCLGRVDVMSLNVVTFTSNCLLLIVGMDIACKNQVILQLVGWWVSWMLH